MKHLLFTVITLCLFQTILSQQIPVNWSKSEWKRWVRSITPIDSSTAVVFKISGILCKLDKIKFVEADTLQKTETSLDYKSMYRLGDQTMYPFGKEIYMNGFNWVNMAGKTCFLRESFSKNVVVNLYLDVLDENLKETGEKITLLEKDYSFSDKQGSLMLMNENHLLVWAYTYNRELKSNDGIDVSVIDKKTAKLLFSKTVKFPESVKDMSLMENPILTSDGNVVLLFHRNYYSNYFKREIDPSVTSDQIVQVLITNDEVTETSAVLPKGLLADAAQLYELNGKIYFPMIGKLISNPENPVSITLMMDSWDDQIDIVGYESISDPIPGHQAIKMVNYSHDRHKNRSVHPTENGSFIVISQKAGSFVDEDMVLTKINKNGEIEWTRYISHRNFTEGADRMEMLTGGYFSYIDKENQLVIILNDNKKYYDENGDYVSGYVSTFKDDRMEYLKEQVSGMVVIDSETGEMTRQTIKGLPSGKIICPVLTQKLADGKYLLYRTNGETENFGILRTR